MKELVDKIKNKQRITARTFNVLTLIAGILAFAPFVDGHFLSGAWALAFVGIFLTISFFVLTMMFARRARKMDNLKTGEKLLVHLQLSDEMLKTYADELKRYYKERNTALMWIVGIFFAIIGGAMLFFMEGDERVGFALIIISIVAIIFFVSKFFPWYFYRKNLKGDKQIMIGEKYAYFNGYFHNWDYPLSGLSKVKQIKQPFYGLHLVYYYTDLTWRHTHEIKIPLPNDFDVKPIISHLKLAN
nr:hypothetical protein [uncultured Draconibacterium sp.]